MLKEITAKTILIKRKKIDSWFLSAYGINLYRGCTHNCVYCDGRDDKYQLEGEFGTDVVFKVNAIELLDRELNPYGKRTPFKGGFFVVCGGVSDSYQHFEREKKITREVLKLLYKYKHPVHMLTKSTLIERDIDLIKEINQQNKAIVSFSFSSVDDEISKLIEPNVPPPSERLKTIRKFKDEGISCGMCLMPVVPFITDSYEMIENSIKLAKNAGVDFIIFSGMTLKEGKQKYHFMEFLKKYFPEYINKYEKIYSRDLRWGSPDYRYMIPVERIFDEIATKYSMPKRIPSKIFASLVSKSELIILILEQLDYLMRLKGKKSPFGYASYSLSQINIPVEELDFEKLIKIRGIGQFTAEIIMEIIKTGRCKYYEKML